MVKSGKDEVILSYHEALLRRSDLDILKGPHFVNDRIIEFYFAYLTSHYNREDVLLVQPALSFWIANCPDREDLIDVIKPLDLHRGKVVVFPVNDNGDVTKPEGGSHWSLLVFVRGIGMFVHHDSYEGANFRDAMRLCKAVVGHMGLNSLDSDVYAECGRVPQQVNGYDCGIYALAIARVICSCYNGAEGLWYAEMAEQVTPPAVTEMRREILQLIEGMMLSVARGDQKNLTHGYVTSHSSS